MAYIYLNDSLFAAIIKNSKEDPKHYVKNLVMQDIKAKGWIK